MATVIAAITPAAPMIHRVCACIARSTSPRSVARSPRSSSRRRSRSPRVAGAASGGDHCHVGDGITTPPAVTACITVTAPLPRAAVPGLRWRWRRRTGRSPGAGIWLRCRSWRSLIPPRRPKTVWGRQHPEQLSAPLPSIRPLAAPLAAPPSRLPAPLAGPVRCPKADGLPCVRRKGFDVPNAPQSAPPPVPPPPPPTHPSTDPGELVKEGGFRGPWPKLLRWPRRNAG